MDPFAQHLQSVLALREEQQRYRHRRTLSSAQGANIVVDNKDLVSFCSNDYLGLANHPDVVAALNSASKVYGVGSGASHLVSGHSIEHEKLEQEIAEYCGRERALLFSTGYMANLGVITALVEKTDAIFQDRLNHASLLDGGRLSGARFSRFLHNDIHDLEKKLTKSDARRKLIAVDSVFSMDGDLAPLAELAALANEHNAWLMIDDAHGFGCLGATGAGSAEHWGLDQHQVPVLMGTLGKGIGTFGAFVAGSEQLIETLIQLSRSYIYTTALPPAVAAATRVSLQLAQSESWRREHLQKLITHFKAGVSDLGYQLMPSATAIQPIVLGDDASALRLSKTLADKGYLISAIRPPTVPEGSARLRITLSAAHSLAQVDGLLAALKAARES